MEPRAVRISVNGLPVTVAEGSSVAAAVLSAGEFAFRQSVAGEPRGPLCGMGICFECRVTIDRVSNQRSCNILAREGMEIITDE